MNRTFRVLLLGLSLFVLAIFLPPSKALAKPDITICYVRQGATGLDDGSSWTNAYTDLQDGLAELDCTQLWVAAGTYLPGTQRTDTFQLRDGLALYGGFAGTETSLYSRDIIANETILSGAITGANSYHVVTGSGADSTAVLDGFTVSDGYADGSGTNGKGGGMYTTGGSPTVRNVTFRNNYANSGGAMRNENGSALAISGSLFVDNSATLGGAIFNAMSNITLANVTFSGNQATDGGALYNSYSNAELDNLTFTGNNASNDGGAIFNEQSAPTVDNTILWANTAGGSGPQIIDAESSSTTIAYSVVEGGFAGTEILTADPLLGSLGDYGGRMLAIPVASDSSAVDAGSGCVAVDQRGLSREGQGSGCDIGAFEFQPVLYAAATGRTSGFCERWTLACELRYALPNAYAGQEIWVQGGTHYPTAGSDRLVSFQLKDGVALYGGFAGTESLRTERDWTLYPTILSGDIGVAEDASDNSEHVVNASFTDASAILDGFQVEHGNAFTFGTGGGMYTVQGSPTIRNSAFALNRAVVGGGMHNYQSAPLLENVWFEANEATHGGGMNNSDSNPVLDGVTFHANIADGAADPNGEGYGGGMRCEQGSRPTLTDVTFTDNSASANGGGLYTTTEAEGTLTWVTFARNEALQAGGGMANNGTAPTLTEVTFSQNRAENGGGLYNEAGAAPIVSSSVFTANQGLLSAEITNFGGAIYNKDSNPQLTNVTISDNLAQVGGGIFNEQSDPQLAEVTFESNQAGNGGGIYNGPASAPTLTDLVFRGNDADKGGGIYNGESSPSLTRVLFENENALAGGAMYNRDSTPTLTDVIFRSNRASFEGGTMYNYGDGYVTGKRVTFVDNAADYGGALYQDDGDGLFENVVFYENTARLGGAINIGYSTLTVNHATFTRNHADNSGGALLISQSTLVVQNSVIWGNTTDGADPQVTVIQTSSGTPTFNTNVIQDGCHPSANCSGTITADPRLEPLGDYGGETPTVALGPGSSAVDAAAGTYSICPNIDQRGMGRPKGAACDIGAFERVDLALAANLPQPGTVHLDWNDTTAWHEGYHLYQSSAPYIGYTFLHAPTTTEYDLPVPTTGAAYYQVYGLFDGTTADRSNRVGAFTFLLSPGS